jgi:hypothetical protein
MGWTSMEVGDFNGDGYDDVSVLSDRYETGNPIPGPGVPVPRRSAGISDGNASRTASARVEPIGDKITRSPALVT